MSWRSTGDGLAGLDTPPDVADLTPLICLDITHFRDVMRQYRRMDDGITTRLNRLVARGRDLGHTRAPGLLRGTGSSSTLGDVGASTYAGVDTTACAALWQEMMSVWTGRERAIWYCIDVTKEAAERASRQRERSAGLERALDADLNDEHVPDSSALGWSNRKSRDTFDERPSRSEDLREFAHRQFNIELGVEQIVRKNSLEVFKTRCWGFTPQFGKSGVPGLDAEREESIFREAYDLNQAAKTR